MEVQNFPDSSEKKNAKYESQHFRSETYKKSVRPDRYTLTTM